MRWIVLCVSNDAPTLLLYRSILELEGHSAFAVATAHEALKVSERIAIDCVVVDCEDNGISATREIVRARPGIPVLFVSDESDVELQVFSETGMFVTKEEAIGELSGCVCELLRRNRCRCDNDRRKLTRTTNLDSLSLHEAFVRWLLPW
jgi:DNA-binding response OmpR family regulator